MHACVRACVSIIYLLRTRPRSSQLTSFVIMITLNDSVNDVSNFVIKSPRDACEASNCISFFQRFQILHLIIHMNEFAFLHVLHCVAITIPQSAGK